MCRQFRWEFAAAALLSVVVLFLAGCGDVDAEQAPEPAGQGTAALPPVVLNAGERLRIVSTTSIVGDVVKNVGGDHIDQTVLMPPGTDPHAFEPTPREVAAVSDAHVVFANGAGLEEFLDPLLESAGATEKMIPLSAGVELLRLEHGQPDDQEHVGEEEHENVDPHIWTDPNNVVQWVHNIEQALSALDPDNAAAYKANAAAYIQELEVLDGWVRDQIARIPAVNRKLVTDHRSFGYFAAEYQLEQVGAIVPGYSTMAEPSAKELAELEDAIRELDIPAVFVGNTVNPDLAQRVAEDTGTQLVFLYTGSLSEPGGEAGSYIDYMRYNVNAIVSALK